MTAIGAAVDPLAAVKAYLELELSSRGDNQHVGFSPPSGAPGRCIMIGYADLDAPTRFLSEHVVDVVVYDYDAERVGLTSHLVLALLLAVSNTEVSTSQGTVRLLSGKKKFGPVDYDDPDVPLVGRRMGVGLLMANTAL